MEWQQQSVDIKHKSPLQSISFEIDWKTSLQLISFEIDCKPTLHQMLLVRCKTTDKVLYVPVVWCRVVIEPASIPGLPTCPMSLVS